jgi:hypothetical protein
LNQLALFVELQEGSGLLNTSWMAATPRSPHADSFDIADLIPCIAGCSPLRLRDLINRGDGIGTRSRKELVGFLALVADAGEWQISSSGDSKKPIAEFKFSKNVEYVDC